MPPLDPSTDLLSAEIASRLAEISKPDNTSLDVFWASHARWPLPPSPSSSSSSGAKSAAGEDHQQKERNGDIEPVDEAEDDSEQDEIHIGIFDSSFNPPTLAHLDIASTSFPHASTFTFTSESAAAEPDRGKTRNRAGAGHGKYTAKLLLLSARNVDKPPTNPGSHSTSAEQQEADKKAKENATGLQRVRMMILQGRHMSESRSESTGMGESNENMAVAVLNFPTFVGKSRIIHHWLDENLPRLLSTPHGRPPRIRLTFLIGSDTLTRLFRPAYYPASSSFPEIGPDMDSQLDYFFKEDRSRVVCVRRYLTEKERGEEEKFVREHEGCRELVRSGGIRFVEEKQDEQEQAAGGVKKGEEMGLISSTTVRERVQRANLGGAAGDEDEEEAAVKALNGLCIEDVARFIAREGLYRQS